MDNKLFTPPDHVNFTAQKLYGEGEMSDVSIAFIDENGGGPTTNHTHKHNHLFIVTEGEAKIDLDGNEIILKKNESFLVKGDIPHSVWNNTQEETVMLGINFSSELISAEKCESLDNVRTNIDAIDDKIVKLIAQRSKFVLRAADFKKSENAVKAPDRVEAVIEKVRKKAVKYNGDPDITEKLYREMINCFINKEINKFNGKKD